MAVSAGIGDQWKLHQQIPILEIQGGATKAAPSLYLQDWKGFAAPPAVYFTKSCHYPMVKKH